MSVGLLDATLLVAEHMTSATLKTRTSRLTLRERTT